MAKRSILQQEIAYYGNDLEDLIFGKKFISLNIWKIRFQTQSSPRTTTYSSERLPPEMAVVVLWELKSCQNLYQQ